MIDFLPHVNATLNAIAGVLLVLGFVAIKRKNELRHKQLMLAAFAVSVLFLVSYVTYHANAGSKKFPKDDYSTLVSTFYYIVLASHVILAAVVPFLAILTIYFGFRAYGDGSSSDEKTHRGRARHRRLAKWTFPIWVYVSITGVLVYLMLYHWCLPAQA